MFQAPLKNWMKEAVITKHISFHCARHTFGSLQADAGTSIYAIQRMLGHKNVETTQIYADLCDASKRESVNRITLKPRISASSRKDAASKTDVRPMLKVVGEDD